MRQNSKFPENSVCKPCWELKYCPYGTMVELFPSPQKKEDLPLIKKSYLDLIEEIKGLNQNITVEYIQETYERLSHLEPETNKYASQYREHVGCIRFGHVCPVFFIQSPYTETIETRRNGRISPKMMLKVARRDNYICQICYKHVNDDEIEFDHIIPLSKGGPTSVENTQLLCRNCNRVKSDSLHHILHTNISKPEKSEVQHHLRLGNNTMNTEDAVKILNALAQGIDPTTGELIEDDHILSNPHVIRALFTGINALTQNSIKLEKTHTSKQDNLSHAGKPWTPEEDQQLIDEFNEGLKVSKIAEIHGRSSGGISSRLSRLGLIESKSAI